MDSIDTSWLTDLFRQTGVSVSQLLSAALLLGVILVLYKVLERGLRYAGKRRRLAPALLLAGRRGLRWVTVVVATLAVLQSLGLLRDAWTALTAIAAMIAIGFVAVWSVLSNTLCSVILLAAGPFRAGDTIEIAPENLKGKVVNFSLLFTTLKVAEGETIQVPNNLFFQRVIRREQARPGEAVDLDRQLLQDEDARV